MEELDNLFDRLFSEEDRKVLLFSEWTTMLDLIEPLLKKRDLHSVRLDGSVPQKLRPGLVHEFQSNPLCRLFLTTNAGSTGQDDHGRPRLTFALPDATALDGLTNVLARLLVRTQSA